MRPAQVVAFFAWQDAMHRSSVRTQSARSRDPGGETVADTSTAPFRVPGPRRDESSDSVCGWRRQSSLPLPAKGRSRPLSEPASATTSGVAAPATGPSGSGYSLTSATGAVYTFSSSAPFSSTGALSLNKPMVGIAGTSDAGGYWQVAGDGGVFATPDATFHGRWPPHT